jgi:glycosyltransferase involved in cell wall biosynthesis
MKVLHVITGLNDGGAEAVLHRLCAADTSNTHTVISMMDDGKYGSLLRELGVVVHTLDMSNGCMKMSAVFKLYKLVKVLKPDVVQTWMYHADFIGGVVARLAGVKNVVWGVHHTTLVKGESKRSTIIISRINAIISNFVPRKIIYCAKKSRETQEFIGFKQDKGVVVSNGYNINDFKPDLELGLKFRAEVGVAENEFLIGHVGRYDPLKDYNSLIASLAVLNSQGVSFKTVLVGTNLDNQNNNLTTDICQQGLEGKILLLGKRNDIPAVMNGFDLFILSSKSEAFSNVLNEAMACGTPCVTTDVGDAAYIVGDTGWVAPPKSPEALAEAMNLAFKENQQNPERWQLRRMACRQRVEENFSIEKMVENYHSVWILT